MGCVGFLCTLRTESVTWVILNERRAYTQKLLFILIYIDLLTLIYGKCSVNTRTLVFYFCFWCRRYETINWLRDHIAQISGNGNQFAIIASNKIEFDPSHKQTSSR